MGMEKRKAEEKRGSRRRASTQVTSGGASWAQVDGETLKYVCCAISQRGGAIRLGYTRDGGAYAIGIYGDGEPYTDYVRPGEDINAALLEIAHLWGNVTGDGSYISSGST